METRLSDAELCVMEVLWSAGQPLTASEVADRVPADRAWSFATATPLNAEAVAGTASTAAATAVRKRVRFISSPFRGSGVTGFTRRTQQQGKTCKLG